MINETDRKYKRYLEDILENGTDHADRTGTGTTRVFGRRLRFGLTCGFPILTTKRVWFRGVFEELMWMLRGRTNIRPLVQRGVSIWTDWAYDRYVKHLSDMAIEPVGKEEFEDRIAKDRGFANEFGELGPIYGKQWRDFEGPNSSFDQIRELIRGLKENPGSRRHIVSAWHPAQTSEMALPPCHRSFQCFVDDGRLSLMWDQRSVDSFIGLPFNIASYALLTHFLAQQAELEVGELLFNGGDCHIYDNHKSQVSKQLDREPKESPELNLTNDPPSDIGDYSFGDVELVGYNPHPPLKAQVAV